MSRFESGMTEAAYRKVLFQSRYRLTNYKVNTTADVKNYIHQLLNFTKPDRPELSSVPQAFTDLEDINHIYPMAGAFFSFPIHTVGYLETFQEDWSNVIAPLYNLSKPFNYFVGRHATDVSFPSTKKMEAEPSNMRYYYRSLLRREPVYAKAICQLMLIDYVCLPQYPLPQVCEFLNSTREEGVRLLTAGRSTVQISVGCLGYSNISNIVELLVLGRPNFFFSFAYCRMCRVSLQRHFCALQVLV